MANENTYDAAVRRQEMEQGLMNQHQQLRAALAPFRNRDSNLIVHARTQLEQHHLFAPEADYDGMLGVAVMDLITLFSSQGHSGMSAELVLELFTKLVKFEEL